MSANIAVGLWLLLFGILGLVNTSVPPWVLGLAAVVAGMVVLVTGVRRGP